MPETTDTALALKVLRELADLNQRELARRAGVGYTTVSDYENGSVPQKRTVAKVLAVFGLKTADLKEVEEFVLYARQKMGIGSAAASAPSSGPPRPEAWRKEAQKLAADWSRFGRRFLHVLELWASSGEEGSRPGEDR